MSHYKDDFIVKYGSEAHQHKLLDKIGKFANNIESDHVHIALGEHSPHKSVLDRVVKHPMSYVKRSAISLENRSEAHPDHLHALAKDDDYMIRRQVAQHGNKEVNDHLVHDEDETVRQEVAKHHPEHAAALMHDHDEFVAGAAARHPETHDHLVNHASWYVRKRVAEHATHPGLEKHLTQLMHDPDYRVREAVAGRSYHSDTVAKHLAKDPEHSVRLRVAANAKSKTALEHIANHDESGHIRDHARDRIPFMQRRGELTESSETFVSFKQFIQDK